MKEVLLNMLAGALETIGESKLISVLQQLHDSKPDQYKLAINGGQALISALQRLVAKSKTPIDDAILKALSEAINESARQNGTSLDEEVIIVEVTELPATGSRGVWYLYNGDYYYWGTASFVNAGGDRPTKPPHNA